MRLKDYDGWKKSLQANKDGGYGESVMVFVSLWAGLMEVQIIFEGKPVAEIAEGWQPVFFYPEKADEVWGDAVRAGYAKRDPARGPLDIMVSASLAIGDDVEDRLAWAKPQLALYIGGMGAKGKNFYHNLATRYGFGEVADHIQELFLAGKKDEAIAAVPDDLVRHVSLVGPRGFVKERLAAYKEAGVTTMLVHPLATDDAEAVRFTEELVTLTS